jgi:hypothetical protein
VPIDESSHFPQGFNVKNKMLAMALLAVSLAAPGVYAQTAPTGTAQPAANAVNASAVQALKDMGAHLQSLKRFQVSTELTGERVLADGQKLQHTATADIDVQRPNKLRARGYRAIDTSGQDQRLYSLSCPLMLGMIITAIPKYTKGKLAPLAKNRQGQPLASKVDALDDPRHSTAHLLAPRGTLDASSVATGAGEGTGTGNGAVREVKEWQAIMDHLCRLPAKSQGELPVIPVDARAAEVRAIKVG